MAVAGPRRRRADARSPQPPPFGPTPGGVAAPDPAGVMRSIEHALEAGRRLRRPMTLVCVEMTDPADEARVSRVATLVRRTVRDTDGVWRDGPASLVVLLTDCDGPNSEPALARIRLRLKGEKVNGGVMMGRAAPPPGLPAGELLALARSDCRRISHH
jgi:hypothetical protein